jgi:hypothetical protein
MKRVLGFLSLLIAVGCAGQAPVEMNPDGDPPPKIKQPPSPKDGSSTAPGCDGVPEHGSCQDGVAVYCDIADGGDGSLRRKDCKALGKACLVDAARGAVCEVVAPQSPGTGDTVCTDTGVTVEGSCGGTGGQTAVWCDPGSLQTITWDCAGDGLSCKMNDCGVLGAFCCGETPPPPPPPTNVCPALGFFGECNADNTKAQWCNGDTLVEKICGPNDSCQIDACADGAYCCPKPAAPVDECATIGVRGICTADGHPRWCSNGTVDEVTCAAGRTCQIDTCGNGAFCCAP